MPPRELLDRTREFSIIIASRPEILQEARELAKIFTKALKTARQNTLRMKNAPRS